VVNQAREKAIEMVDEFWVTAIVGVRAVNLLPLLAMMFSSKRAKRGGLRPAESVDRRFLVLQRARHEPRRQGENLRISACIGLVFLELVQEKRRAISCDRTPELPSIEGLAERGSQGHCIEETALTFGRPKGFLYLFVGCGEVVG